MFIQSQIQQQHIHARFTQKAELASFGVRCDHLPNLLFGHAAFARHAGNLKIRSGRRNVWIKARSGSRNQINRNWLARILGLQFLNVALDPINQFLAGRPKV